MTIEILVALLILLMLSALASVDMAFSQLSDVSLRKLFTEAEERNNPRALEFLQEIVVNRPRFRFALSTSIQILLIIFSVLVVLIVFRFTQSPAEMFWFSLLIGLFFSALFRQLIPRVMTLSNPEGKLIFMLPLIRPIYRILPFLADPFEPSFRGRTQYHELTEAPDINEEKGADDADDFQALIEVGEAEGIIEQDDRELLEKMFEFGDTEVDEIMTPRTDIIAIPIDSTVKEARDQMIEEKFSRLPVYTNNVDNIEGVIYVRDILNSWADGNENRALADILRPTYFVPETKLVSELLKSMQLNHVQIAMVIDEYGGIAGLVTVEDIIEEIVGEIEDEDSAAEIEEIFANADGSFDVLASTEIGKIERLFEMEIADDDFTTIAGLVTMELGYVPKIGETLVVRGLNIEILKADSKRLQLLRLRKANSNQESIDSESE